MGIRNLFKREEVSRLNNVELREFYLFSKKSEKKESIFFMIISAIFTIGITSFSLSQKTYWLLAISIVALISFIFLMTKYGRLIEDLFENKIIEGENES